MIHAYLFIQNIREGNGGHGPNFKRIMENINRVAGTNITVYHTFHDEVALYKTHIWRCNGICQHRKPFYGWVRVFTVKHIEITRKIQFSLIFIALLFYLLHFITN